LSSSSLVFVVACRRLSSSSLVVAFNCPDILCLCIPIVTYVLLCIFCFHRANWYSSATLTVVFPYFFLSCKTNARVKLAKTEHCPHSSQINCVVLCIVCV
jgi:hypothetical protein